VARRKSQGPTASSVPSLVKDLVDQFDDPLVFYRELIQNAIDAGSNRIDVSLEYDGEEVIIRLEDDGEGMDENVIDNFLLVLFRSTKEEDFTKIGKFGIGFVSVFALRPSGVRVFTSKSGESWRIDFPSYKRYEKYRLSSLRDGTLIEIKKKIKQKAFDKLVTESRDTIRYWCKHSEARIFFSVHGQGRPEQLSEPFGLGGEGYDRAALQHKEEGTEIELGFSLENPPFFGYYNRGLTLKEGRWGYYPGVRFKAKSRYLEHTLTRDNVMQDENYKKLMEIVKDLVSDELPKVLKTQLFEISREISKLAVAGNPDASSAGLGKLSQSWLERAAYLRWLFSGKFARWKRSDWPVFPSFTGKPVSLEQIKKQATGGKLYHDAAPNPITRYLQTHRGVGLVLPDGPWIACIVSWLNLEAVCASKALMLPKVVQDPQLPQNMRSFVATLRKMDAACGAKYTGIRAADLAYPSSSVKDEIFVTQSNPGSLSVIQEPVVSSLFGFGRKQRWALLNIQHPSAIQMAQLHATQPGLAAFLCLKMMHLHDGKIPAERETDYSNLAEKLEARLLKSALELDRRAAQAAS
jgi:molecular chaperone HtpG